MSMHLYSFYTWQLLLYFFYDTVSSSDCLFKHCTRKIKAFDDILVFPASVSRQEEKRATFEAYM